MVERGWGHGARAVGVRERALHVHGICFRVVCWLAYLHCCCHPLLLPAAATATATAAPAAATRCCCLLLVLLLLPPAPAAPAAAVALLLLPPAAAPGVASSSHALHLPHAPLLPPPGSLAGAGEQASAA